MSKYKTKFLVTILSFLSCFYHGIAQEPMRGISQDQFNTLKTIIVNWMEQSPDFHKLKGVHAKIDEVKSVESFTINQTETVVIIGKHWVYEIDSSLIMGFYDDPSDCAYRYHILITIKNNTIIKSKMVRGLRINCFF